MSSRQDSKSREMSHFTVAIAAVLTAVTLRLIGQTTQWASITGWSLTAVLVFGVVLYYAWTGWKLRTPKRRTLPSSLEPVTLPRKAGSGNGIARTGTSISRA